MRDYRLYILGHDGHFAGVIELSCEDDAEAIKTAMKHKKGQPLELWRLGEKITTIPSDNPANS
jgi:hypothetical protein